jgi:phage terminase large subunit-like protein
MPDRVPGKHERLWRERNERDMALCAKPGGHPRGLWFDATRAARAVKFIEGLCTHGKGEWAGKPLILTELQREVIGQIFGWKRADGTRRYRTAHVEVPRKWGKTTIGGGLALYLMCADGEQGAEVYSAATKMDQAAICWKDAAAMVKSSTELKRFVRVFRGSMTCETTGSSFKPLGADSSTLDGLNPSAVILDELHAHKDRSLLDVLDTAMGARRQPLMIQITTAGVYDPDSVGWQQHNHAVQVLEQVIDDDSFFAFISAADEPPADNPEWYFSEAAQRQANPGYGVSPKAEFLAKQAQKAKDQPSFLNTYLRLHLNVWTQQVTRWLPMDKWNACEAPLVHGADVRALALAREASLRGKACCGGLDLSSKLDLTALVLEFPSEDDAVELVCRFWLPEARAAEAAKKGQRFYQAWADAGWLTLTPGDVIDYEFIRAELNDLTKAFRLRELAYDPWGATDLATRLASDGIVMVEARQGFKTLSEPCKDVEAKVVARKVRHAWNPVLRWCASNAVISTDAAGNIKPDKEKASGRIDGIVAWAMARSRGIVVKDEPGSLLLDQGGLFL